MKLVFAAILVSVAPLMAANVYDFSVLPQGGTIAGDPGSTIGWGYSVENESTSLWLVTTGLDMSVFEHGTPNFVLDFPAIAPGASVTVPFDIAKGTGLAEITWDSSAPAGYETSGNFHLSAEWWNGDPLGNGAFLSTAPVGTQPYVAAVTATATPEPATIFLISLPLLACGLLRRAKRARRSAVGVEK
jgi:hypothetical protein